LVSHLDESRTGSDSEQSFRRHRGQVLKCGVLGVLDEPFAEHATDVGVPQLVNPSRYEERVVVTEVLAKLESAGTIESFYDSRVTFPNGEESVLGALASNVRRELEVEEGHYVAHVRGLTEILVAAFGLVALTSLSDDEFAEAAVAPCRSLVKKYADDGVDQADLLAKVINSLYLHLGYKFERARKYLLDAGGDHTAVKIDPNDFEDGAIAAHISLLGGRVLVTGDLGTARALESALGALSRSTTSRGVALPVTCRVAGVTEFLGEALA
jgi:hypothetical protein